MIVESIIATDAPDIPPLSQQAYRYIRQRIIDGEYSPGQQLSARRLVGETGLGATPLREGLTKLHHEGLVQAMPRRGYVVSALDRKAIDDFFAVWSLIGPLIVELGVSRRDEATRRAIEICVVQSLALSETALDAANLLEFNRLSAERFRLLAVATGNAHLIAINERLEVEQARIFTFYIRHTAAAGERAIGPGREEGGRRFIELLGARDGTGAAANTRAAIAQSYRELCAAIPGA